MEVGEDVYDFIFQPSLPNDPSVFKLLPMPIQQSPSLLILEMIGGTLYLMKEELKNQPSATKPTLGPSSTPTRTLIPTQTTIPTPNNTPTPWMLTPTPQ